MNCENKFCIYENDGFCKLDEVSVDMQGNCRDCMYVNIDENLLDDLKQKHLKELESRYYTLKQ